VAAGRPQAFKNLVQRIGARRRSCYRSSITVHSPHYCHFDKETVQAFNQCNPAAPDEPVGPSEEDVKPPGPTILRSLEPHLRMDNAQVDHDAALVSYILDNT